MADRHLHTVNCWTKSSSPTCGMQEHTHRGINSSCYTRGTDKQGNPKATFVCGAQAHTHAEACYSKHLTCGY